MKPHDMLLALVVLLMALHLTLYDIRVATGTVGGRSETVLTWCVLMGVLVGGLQWALADRRVR